MNYNNNMYTQQPYLQQQAPAYNAYRQMPQQQFNNWNSVNSSSPQVRPVSSIEEVRAYPIDFDGSVFYFHDSANRKIYTKQINLDGTASINMYELKEMPMQKEIVQLDTSIYITREEFDQAMIQLRKSIESSVASQKEEVHKETKPVLNF